MTAKRKPKAKLSDAERHKRFVAMAREVGASDDPKDFEKAFKKVAQPKAKPTGGWVKTGIEIGNEGRKKERNLLSRRT